MAKVLLGLAGFMIYGPDMLMAGAGRIDMSFPHVASMTTGFMMCVGALVAIFSGAGFGCLKDFAHGDSTLVS